MPQAATGPLLRLLSLYHEPGKLMFRGLRFDFRSGGLITWHCWPVKMEKISPTSVQAVVLDLVIILPLLSGEQELSCFWGLWFLSQWRQNFPGESCIPRSVRDVSIFKGVGLRCRNLSYLSNFQPFLSYQWAFISCGAIYQACVLKGDFFKAFSTRGLTINPKACMTIQLKTLSNTVFPTHFCLLYSWSCFFLSLISLELNCPKVCILKRTVLSSSFILHCFSIVYFTKLNLHFA